MIIEINSRVNLIMSSIRNETGLKGSVIITLHDIVLVMDFSEDCLMTRSFITSQTSWSTKTL
jgi:hypothetical protein